MDKKKRNIIIALGVAIIIVTIIILVSTLTRKVYTITFNSNGGTEINAVKVKKDGLLEKPEDPIKDGYVFDGWFYNDELFDFTTKIEKDITLEARYSVVSEFNLNTNSLSLTVGDSATLEANEKDGLTWQSSNEEVVKVENGKVTALKKGSATITVTNKDDKTASCEVTVREKEADEVVVTKVAITGQKEVEVGSTLKLTAKITPSNATNKDVTWTSSNDTIAKVDKNGKVTALKEGTVTITVTTNNGKTATIRITVTAKKETKPADGSIGENSSTGGNLGSTGGNNTGSGSTGGSGNKQPSNPSTGGSTSGGTTGGNTGESTDPKPEESKNVPVTGVSLSGKSSVNVNDTITLTVNINPSKATNKKYTCTGDNASVATVSADCKVTGKDDGEVTVTVTTEDGHHTASYKVTVKSTYRVEFKRDYIVGFNKVAGYYVTIYKNNIKWTGYDSLIIDGNYKTDDYLLVGSDIPDEEVKKLASIKVNLKNGDSIDAPVSYVN